MTQPIYSAQAKSGATEFRFEPRNVDLSANTISIPKNSVLITATPITLTNARGTLPTGLSLATTYYVIRLSDTSIKLATSANNANAGTAIDITGQGSGIHCINS